MPNPSSTSGLALPGARVVDLARALGSSARACATLRWVYANASLPGALPERIPGVAAGPWESLRAACAWTLPRVRAQACSPDGTVKSVLRFVDGAEVESVLIPARHRSTVCVSSQAGCTRRCAFCATARLGFRRSLTASEIVAQFVLARREAPPNAPARNVVFMGMGEPMDNLDAVLAAVEVLTQQPEPRLAAGHITVSTSGVLPGMRRFLRESRARLALSLNGTTDAQRAALMPQTRTWPVAALLEALREDAGRRRGHAFIEYVLFEGHNDADADAERLVVLLEGLPARVNLIPHNPIPSSPLRPPREARVLAFQAQVHRAGVRCLVRWPRGREISGACGQLAFTDSRATPRSPGE